MFKDLSIILEVPALTLEATAASSIYHSQILNQPLWEASIQGAKTGIITLGGIAAGLALGNTIFGKDSNKNISTATYATSGAAVTAGIYLFGNNLPLSFTLGLGAWSFICLNNQLNFNTFVPILRIFSRKS